jgi:hypothetical protein
MSQLTRSIGNNRQLIGTLSDDDFVTAAEVIERIKK